MLKNYWTQTRFFLQCCVFGHTRGVSREDLCFAMVEDSLCSRGVRPFLMSAFRRLRAAVGTSCRENSSRRKTIGFRGLSASQCVNQRAEVRQHRGLVSETESFVAEPMVTLPRNSLFRQFLTALVGRLNFSTVFRTSTFGACSHSRNRWNPVVGLRRPTMRCSPVSLGSSASLRLVEVSVRQ